MHCYTSFTLFALVLTASAGAELPPEALEALPVDDACVADPASEECSASFRQLRGLQKRTEAAEHQTANASKTPGVCCFSAEDSNDMCGTCYPTGIASEDDLMCSSKAGCGGCGGTWCKSVCVMGAADPNKKCETAFDTGIAEEDSYCAQNEENCGSCNGAWCMTGPKKTGGRKANSSKTEETATGATATAGFCCYRAEDDNMCGACADVASDATCSTEVNCATCGGTWCAGPKCVIGFADPAKPCSSAFPEGGVAEADSYCSKNEADCGNCKGHWCPFADIKYVEGEKDEAPADGKEQDEEPADDETDEDPSESGDEPSDEEPADGEPADASPSAEDPAEEGDDEAEEGEGADDGEEAVDDEAPEEGPTDDTPMDALLS